MSEICLLHVFGSVDQVGVSVSGTDLTVVVCSSVHTFFVRLAYFPDRFQGFDTGNEEENSECSADGTDLVASKTWRSIYSPNHPLPYPGGITCKWTITNSRPEQMIVIKFEAFEVEGSSSGSCYDILSFTDGEWCVFL